MGVSKEESSFRWTMFYYTVGYLIFILAAQAYAYVVSIILAGVSAQLLASYSVVLGIITYMSYLFGFLPTAATALVGRTASELEFDKTGVYINLALITSLLCGFASFSIVYPLRNELVDLFSPQNSNETLVDSTVDTLAIFSIELIFTNPGAALTSVLFGIFFLKTLYIAYGILFASLGGVSLALFYSGFGLISFAYGTLVSTILFAGFMLLIVFGREDIRERFSLMQFRANASNEELWSFLKAMNGTGFRALTTNTRYIVSLLLAVRIGIIEAAVYSLVDRLTGFTWAFGRSIGYAGNFLGARAYGYGNAKSNHLAVVVLGRIVTRVSVILGVGVAIVFSVSGTNIVVASAVESERVEYARIFTTEFFVVFLFMQVLHATTAIFENILIAVQDFVFVGAINIVGFCVLYLPIAFVGADESDLFTIYLAELAYFLFRAVLVAWRWYFFFVPRLKATSTQVVEEQGSEEFSKQLKGIGILCCCTKPGDVAEMLRAFGGFDAPQDGSKIEASPRESI